MPQLQQDVQIPSLPSASRDAILFPVLGPKEIECLMDYGTKIELSDGDVVYQEGEPEDEFYVILAGELKITKYVAGEKMVLANHHPGHFTGALTMLLGGNSIATGFAVGPTTVLRIDTDSFLRVLAECPEVGKLILHTMAKRRPEVDAISRQREKLAALGKLSAGLAHELNNPASAIGRAACQLMDAVQRQQAMGLDFCRKSPTEEQIGRLSVFQKAAQERADSLVDPLDPLTQSDNEQELGDWLEERGVKESWNVAGNLAVLGIDRAWIEGAAQDISPGCLPAAVNWVDATLSTRALLRQVEESGTRISTLVQAIKDYSYMDQAPRQEIDIHEGLDSTVTILQYKLRKAGVEIVREYDRSLPRISAYGSELNQVWTNLIANSIDALDGPGHIWLRTCRDRDRIMVEVADDGPGIPKDVQARVFDPFFTTKEVGHGTGLGLDISYKIIVDRHHGDIRVASKPGDTQFQVRLPIARITPAETPHGNGKK